jgi:hypothetical protein
VKQYDAESHKFDNVAPELAFVATGIIVLKMVYGLDGRERFAGAVLKMFLLMERAGFLSIQRTRRVIWPG